MHLRILGHPTCIAHLIQNNRKPHVLKGLNIPIGIMTVFYTTLAPTVLPQLLPGKLLKTLVRSLWSAVGRATELCPALTETFMSLQGDLHSRGWRQMSLLWWGGVKNPPGGTALGANSLSS